MWNRRRYPLEHVGRYAQPHELGLNRKNNAFFGSNYGATWDLQRGHFRGSALRTRRSRAEATKFLVLQSFQSKILQCPSAAGLEDLQNFKCTDGCNVHTHPMCWICVATCTTILAVFERHWTWSHWTADAMEVNRSVSITCFSLWHGLPIPSPPFPPHNQHPPYNNLINVWGVLIADAKPRREQH